MTARRKKPRLPSYVSAPANDNDQQISATGVTARHPSVPAIAPLGLRTLRVLALEDRLYRLEMRDDSERRLRLVRDELANLYAGGPLIAFRLHPLPTGRLTQSVPAIGVDRQLPATPTPERLAHAAGHMLSIAGTVRLVDRALDRLHRAGELDPDAKRNNLMHAAGEQYLADYYNGGMAPLGAVDYGRPPVDGSSPKGESSFREGARERWSRARKAMGKAAQAVDRVVLHDGAADIVAVRLGLAVLVKRYDLGR